MSSDGAAAAKGGMMGFTESVLDVGTRARARLLTLALTRSFHSIGRGTRIIPPFRLGNLGRVSLGEDVYIGQRCWMEVIPGEREEMGPVIRIGDHVRIGMDVTITAVKSVVIEDYAAIARNVFICDHGHEFRDPHVPVILQGLRKVAPVRVGYGAWLGHGVVLLPGVSIGRNAVVGANSVVNADVPDYSVAVGAPARVVERYDGERAQWEKVPSR